MGFLTILSLRRPQANWAVWTAMILGFMTGIATAKEEIFLALEDGGQVWVKQAEEGILVLSAERAGQDALSWKPRRVSSERETVRLKGRAGESLDWERGRLVFDSGLGKSSPFVGALSGKEGDWRIELPWEERIQYGLGVRCDTVRLVPGEYILKPGVSWLFTSLGRGMAVDLPSKAKGFVRFHENGSSEWHLESLDLNLFLLSFPSPTSLVRDFRRFLGVGGAFPFSAIGSWLDARVLEKGWRQVESLRECHDRELPYRGILIRMDEVAKAVDEAEGEGADLQARLRDVAEAAGYEVMVDSSESWTNRGEDGMEVWGDVLGRSRMLLTGSLDLESEKTPPALLREDSVSALEYSRQMIIDTYSPWSLLPLRFDTMPWHFGEQVFSQVRGLLWTRINLIPYMERLQQEAKQGVPLVVPIWWTCPWDQHAYEWETQYQLGPGLLVAPSAPWDQDRSVYFPQGEWIAWWERSIWQGPGVYPMPRVAGDVLIFMKRGYPLPVDLGDSFLFGDSVRSDFSRCLFLMPDRKGKVDGVSWDHRTKGLHVELEEGHGYSRFLFGVNCPDRVFAGKRLLRQAKNYADLARGVDGWCWLNETGAVAVRARDVLDLRFFLEGATPLNFFDHCECPTLVPGDRTHVDISFSTREKTLQYPPVVICNYWDGTRRDLEVHQVKGIWHAMAPVPDSAKAGGSMTLEVRIPDLSSNFGLRLFREVMLQPVIEFSRMPQSMMIRARDSIRVGLTKRAESGLSVKLELDAPAGMVVENAKRHLFLEPEQAEVDVVYPYFVRSGVPMGERIMTVNLQVHGEEIQPWKILTIKPFPWLVALGNQVPATQSTEWSPLPSQAFLDSGDLALDEALHLGSWDNAYLRTEFSARESRRVLFRLRAEGTMSLWLNGMSMHSFSGQGMGQEETVEGRMRQGNNEILLGTSPGETGWRLSLRVTNPDGSPLAAWYPVER